MSAGFYFDSNLSKADAPAEVLFPNSPQGLWLVRELEERGIYTYREYMSISLEERKEILEKVGYTRVNPDLLDPKDRAQRWFGTELRRRSRKKASLVQYKAPLCH